MGQAMIKFQRIRFPQIKEFFTGKESFFDGRDGSLFFRQFLGDPSFLLFKKSFDLPFRRTVGGINHNSPVFFDKERYGPPPSPASDQLIVKRSTHSLWFRHDRNSYPHAEWERAAALTLRLLLHSVLAAIGQDIVPHLLFCLVYPEMALAEEIGIQLE